MHSLSVSRGSGSLSAVLNLQSQQTRPLARSPADERGQSGRNCPGLPLIKHGLKRNEGSGMQKLKQHSRSNLSSFTSYL